MLGQRCEVEEVIATIARQQKAAPRWRRLYLVGFFLLWKRAFGAGFCRPLAEELALCASRQNGWTGDEQVLVGRSLPRSSPRLFGWKMALSAPRGFPTCVAPLPVAGSGQDPFDSAVPAGSSSCSNYQGADPVASSTGEQLLLPRENKAEQHNVGALAQLHAPPMAVPVLVVGQGGWGCLHPDRGSPTIRSNEQLLWAVRAAKPEAHILYKPHPDVVVGTGRGYFAARLAECVDSQVLDIGLTSLYPPWTSCTP